MGFIAVAPRGWLGPEPTGLSLGGQGERCGRDDLPACWAKVISVLIKGKEHDIVQAGLTDGKCWIFDLGVRASRRIFADSGRAEGRVGQQAPASKTHYRGRAADEPDGNSRTFPPSG